MTATYLLDEFIDKLILVPAPTSPPPCPRGAHGQG
jgi:hypothetical protein